MAEVLVGAIGAGLGISFNLGLGGVFTASISHASLVALLSSTAGTILLCSLGAAIVITAVAVLLYAAGCMIAKIKGNDKMNENNPIRFKAESILGSIEGYISLETLEALNNSPAFMFFWNCLQFFKWSIPVAAGMIAYAEAMKIYRRFRD